MARNRSRTTKSAPSPAPPGSAVTPRRPLLTGARALGIFFGVAVVYFLPAFLPGRHVYGSDYIAAAYFYHEWISELFGRGEIPKWLPYVYGGLPWFANPGMTWYPFRFLADWLLPADRIFPAIYVIQITVAGFGTYLLARELGARRWVALVVGLAFQLTGQLMSFTLAGHDGRMIGMSSGPLFLFFLARGIRTGGVLPFAGAAATIGFAMLSFQIQTAYYVLLAGALWAAFLLFHEGWHRRPGPLARRVALGLGAVALGFALNAVNFLPFMDYVDDSPRAGGRGYEYAVAYSMAPEHTLSLAVPEQHGLADAYQERIIARMRAGLDTSGENTFKLHTEYVGALVLGLFLLGFLYCRRDRRWWFFLALTLFAFSIAFGGHTPLYRLYYAVLPGTRMFRTPDIGFIMVPMALAAMAALALERMAALRAARAGARRRAADDDVPELSMATWVFGGMAVAAVLGGLTLGNAPTAAQNAAGGWIRFALFCALLATVFWLWTGGRVRSRGFAIAIALLTVADLWVVDRVFFRTVEPPEQMFRADDVASFLQARQAQEDPFRVWVVPGSQVLGPQVPTYHGHDNYLMRFGIEQASGEHGNQIQRWNEYLGAGQQVYVDYHNVLTDLMQAAREGDPTQYLGASNVRYVVTMAEVPLPGWTRVHSGPSALIYENPAATPRAWLAAEVEALAEGDAALERMLQPGWDPAATAFVYGEAPEGLGSGPLEASVHVREHRHDRVTMQASASRPALLVLADNWYPGWEATVDGAEVPIHRVNHTFRGVVVPAGEHEVVFTFRPPELYLGLWIYLGSLALLGLAAVWAVLAAVRRRATPGSAAPAGAPA